MARPHEDLYVRRHQRRTCDHEARLSVSADGAASIVFARGVADAAGEIEARVVDFSAGGVGLGVAVFLPRGCPLRLRLTGVPAGVPPVCLVIRRVQMTDSTPRYYIGSAFDDSGLGSAGAIAALLTHLESVTPAPAGARP